MPDLKLKFPGPYRCVQLQSSRLIHEKHSKTPRTFLSKVEMTKENGML